MLKKASTAAIILLLLIPVVTDAQGISQRIEVYYNDIGIILDNKEIKLEGRPFIYEDRVYVPIRSMGAALGIDVDWNEEMKTVILRNRDYKFPLAECRPEEGESFVYGEIISIDYADYTITLRQHFDDNSVPITNPLQVDEDVVIVLKQENNLHFYELKQGSIGGFILNSQGTVRGIIIARPF